MTYLIIIAILILISNFYILRLMQAIKKSDNHLEQNLQNWKQIAQEFTSFKNYPSCSFGSDEAKEIEKDLKTENN